MPGGKFLRNIVDRATEKALDKAKERIKHELAPQSPGRSDEEVYGEEAVEKGFLERITDRAKERLRGTEYVKNQFLDPEDSGADEATLNYRLHYAGQNHVLVWLEYIGHSSRYCAGYEIKPGKGKHAGTMYYWAFCLAHNKIHKFNMAKITGCRVTNIPYSPMWPVKL